MTRIDLIPPELVEKHKAKRVISLIVIGGGIIALILVAVYLITLGQIAMASKRVDTIKSENTKVQTYITNLKPYKDRKTALDQRQMTIDTITKNRVLWSSILNDISMVVPGGIWLKDVKIDIDPILAAQESTTAPTTELPPPITITGYARTHADVARWLVHLGEINQFRSVWLNYATEQAQSATSGTAAAGTTGSAQKVIEFQTTVRMTKFVDASKK